MENPKSAFSIKKRFQSFAYAFSGIVYFFRTEHNARIHAFAMLAVIGLGFYYPLVKTDWCWLIVAIALVIGAEMFNTCIERLTDVLFPDYDERAKRIKDVAAGAVLVCSAASALIGALVFAPYLFF